YEVVKDEAGNPFYLAIEVLTDSLILPAVTSSNPRIGSIKIVNDDNGVPVCVVPLINNKKGNVTFTMKALDGTGKSATFKYKIK
ncbi:MAG: hypothetical protein IJS86_01180, partial [Lachnospiraceae bacterium]|nr:hypothetical protein [Lachnospiraceae bacterium]